MESFADLDTFAWSGDWLPEEVVRDERGFVYTGREVPMDHWSDGRPPAALETTVPGIFAAGDLRA
ncbi:MAG TPA: hypothetical protein VFX34_05505, partial [Sporosarcina sp.]|nr:hypothetical protein [Sporosarcina sp.]